MAGKKRRFGRIRQLPSGRWQARYSGPDGLDHPAPHTFRTKREAQVWLTQTEAEMLDGSWISPEAGNVTVGEYAARWIIERPGLRPTTVELYRMLLRCHIAPVLGQRAMSEVTQAVVRRWRSDLLAARVGPVTVAKAYRLLRAVFTTATDDEIVRRNPCRIPGAGKEPTPERPTATIRQVFDLADAVGPRFRSLVLLATFAGLRWGELMALRRRCLDLEARTVRVDRAVSEVGRRIVVGPPKSAAGVRVVALPSVIVPFLREHLATFAEPGQDGRVFVGAKGATVRRSNWYPLWGRACRQVGVEGLHFHDLRHTGNTLAASTGASTRELMNRMGHDSMRAALIYQHATSDRDRAIADALDELVREQQEDDGDPEAGEEPTGT